MADPSHAAQVDAWLERAAKGQPPQELLRLFDVALAALWARTTPTLGEVTLTAIAERVTHNAGEKFPFFATLKIDHTGGLGCDELRERITGSPRAPLLEAIRFVLVEFLTVLGNLTAEILTPELHAALGKVALPRGSAGRKETRK